MGLNERTIDGDRAACTLVMGNTNDCHMIDEISNPFSKNIRPKGEQYVTEALAVSRVAYSVYRRPHLMGPLALLFHFLFTNGNYFKAQSYTECKYDDDRCLWNQHSNLWAHGGIGYYTEECKNPCGVEYSCQIYGIAVTEEWIIHCSTYRPRECMVKSQECPQTHN
ncbi:hypothetical protein SOMG_05023 [Schizosaccharomyces osmophilus]|uniref:Uncharacterized protein n=1 Tax=Schizosaccharomyces osmophilus TaxID=2545709 RepID=A0AAE9WEY8_9SCHI|nr:uncharacterized protein SOMG_05023 [Schizosaccharomyces osmophilus]WBW75059.1 hypothetical protein SOMG_05023 [Schizosaccharomyces osmophilus]